MGIATPIPSEPHSLDTTVVVRRPRKAAIRLGLQRTRVQDGLVLRATYLPSTTPHISRVSRDFSGGLCHRPSVKRHWPVDQRRVGDLVILVVQRYRRSSTSCWRARGSKGTPARPGLGLAILRRWLRPAHDRVVREGEVVPIHAIQHRRWGCCRRLGATWVTPHERHSTGRAITARLAGTPAR